jgi:hypothetical protein
MKLILRAALLMAVLAAAARLCPAAPAEKAGGELPEGLRPVLTVRLADYQRLHHDLAWLGKLVQVPLADLLEKKLLGGSGLEGLDKTRPGGFVLKTDATGNFLLRQAFVPVSDLKKLLASLTPILGAARDAGQGVFEIEFESETFYAKEANGWALICDRRAGLADFPADPTTLIAGLGQYDVAIRASIKNLPDPWRQRFLVEMGQGMQFANSQWPGENRQRTRSRIAAAKATEAQITRLAGELETVTEGIALDEKTSSAHVDYLVTPKPGTKTAAYFAALADSKTDFSGFFSPDNGLAMSCSLRLTPNERLQAKWIVGGLARLWLDELDRVGEEEKDELADKKREKEKKQYEAGLQRVKERIEAIDQGLEKTLEGGTLDVAITLSAGETLSGRAASKAVSAVCAMRVADSSKMEALVKEYAQQVATDDAEAAKRVKLDAEQYQGVRLHILPGPADFAAKPPDKQGETGLVVVGVDPKSIYLATGPDALAALKKAIGKSKAEGEKPIPPFRFALAVTPMARLVAPEGSNGLLVPRIFGLDEIMKRKGGGDLVTATIAPIGQGVRLRVEMEETALRTIGVLGKLAAPMFGR